MANTSNSVYASTPFKFIVEGNAFYIHADLVSRHSKPLDRMMNGEMLEAQNGYAVLKEVEESTFVRFIEWAYQGYYTTGRYVHRLPDASSSVRGVVEEDGKFETRAESPLYAPTAAKEPSVPEPAEEYIAPRPEHKVRRRYASNMAGVDLRSEEPSESPKSSRTELQKDFIHRKTIVRQESISIPPPRPKQKLDEDYTDVFLSHAKLYVFAEKYDIQTLRTLALENLHNVLAIFTLYKERTGDIITTLRIHVFYCADNLTATMNILFYQPHSGKYSPFPHDELLPTSKSQTPSSSNPTSRQSSIHDDKSGDDELPSLQKLLSPTTQACRANLKVG